MKRKLKRMLALTLVLAMVLTLLPVTGRGTETVEAAVITETNANVADTVVVTGYCNVISRDYYKVSGDFTATFLVTQAEKAISSNWNTPILAFGPDEDCGDSDSKWYFKRRTDNYVNSGYGDNHTSNGAEITNENNFNWGSFTTDMPGATHTVKVTRSGNDFVINDDVTKDGRSLGSCWSTFTDAGIPDDFRMFWTADTCTFTINSYTYTPAPTLNASAASEIALGEKAQISVVTRNLDAETEAAATTYASDKTEVATVDASGRITGVAQGTATITVTKGSLSAQVIVHVADMVKLTGVQTSEDYTLKDEESVSITLIPKTYSSTVYWAELHSGEACDNDVYGHEASDYVTTVPYDTDDIDYNGIPRTKNWIASDASAAGTVRNNAGTLGFEVKPGHIYEITAERSGRTAKISIQDVTANSDCGVFTANADWLAAQETLQFHIQSRKGLFYLYSGKAASFGFTAGSTSGVLSDGSMHGTDRSKIAEYSDSLNTPPSEYKVPAGTQADAKDGLYGKYFLKDTLQEVRITLPEENFNYMLQAAVYNEKPTVMTTSVRIGDTTLGYTGLKTKGNFTKRATWYNSGSDRFSFTVNFGKYINKKNGFSSKQNFYGLKKVSFNNFYFDKTMMKEYNAFRLMTEMGIATPEYGLAKVYINDQYYGVYFMVEPVDSTVLERYYNTSSKKLGDYLTKPDYINPVYYDGLDAGKDADGNFTMESLKKIGLTWTTKADGTPDEYFVEDDSVLSGWWHSDTDWSPSYSGLWENDWETLQDVAETLPTVFTWLEKLTNLSNGKSADGKTTLDVNSDAYLKELESVIEVDEMIRYFATHSFVVQMDNLFTWHQNYGLYVDTTGKSLLVPWDYDLAWGYGDAPSDGEAVANYDIEKLYNNVAGTGWTDNFEEFYKDYPLFHVIYQNNMLREKFRTYIEDCSKLTTVGGKTSDGAVYAAGRYQDTIEDFYAQLVSAVADEEMAANAYYLQYPQPDSVKLGLKGLKQIIGLRSVGVWLQTNGIDAYVTAYGYPTGSLGNDSTYAEYKTSGTNLAVVNTDTGIFAVSDWSESETGPILTAEKLSSDATAYKKAAELAEVNAGSLSAYALSINRSASKAYTLYVPTTSENAKIYLYQDNALTELTKTKTYGDGTAAVTLPVNALSTDASAPTYLIVVQKAFTATIAAASGDEGVESFDAFYSQKYMNASEHEPEYLLARDADSGKIDISGEGQINFRVNVKPGYQVAKITVAAADGGEAAYKNLKTPAQTGVENVYRVTKVNGDLAVVVTTARIPDTGFAADFEGDEQVSAITVYAGQSDTTGTIYNEKTTTKKGKLKIKFATDVLDKNGAVDINGNGQLNFKVETEEGYAVSEIEVVGGYYKNIKTPSDTGTAGVYRITGILGDVEVTIHTTPIVASAFTSDQGVDSIDVFYTQSYSTPSARNVTSANARDSVTGEIIETGDGQINFRVNVKNGYRVKNVSVQIPVDENGNATASYKNIKGAEETGIDGIYRITKVSGGLKITITTEQVPVASVGLSRDSLSFTEGDAAAAITATVMPSNAYDPTVTWSTSNEAVATVINGTVTPVGVGTATITATAGDRSATCIVTVNAKPAVQVPDTGAAGATQPAAGNGTDVSAASGTAAPAQQENEITLAKDTIVLSYSAKAQTVKLASTAKPTAFFGTITYTSGNKKVKVSAKGVVTLPKGFSGSVKITLTVAETDSYTAATQTVTIKVPKAAAVSSAKNTAKKTATVTWKKASGVTGYQIQYATDKKFKKNAKTVTIAKAKTTSTKLSKLSKKTYYVRIRTYIKDGSKKYYSGWSGAKTVKIKK